MNRKTKLRVYKRIDKQHGPYPSTEAIKEHPEIAGTRCYEWTGYCNGGYGRFWYIDSAQYVHVVLWAHRHGKIPEGIDVCHKCDNKKCLRDSHHFLGTRKANIHDCERKGRARHPRGSCNGNSKLTDKSVRRIRKEYSNSNSYSKLGKKFGVTTPTIAAIIHRQTWRHVA